MKCQTTVRSRWIPEVKTDKGDIIRAHSKPCSPEPCGAEGSEYFVRKGEQDYSLAKMKGALHMSAGNMAMRAVFCDKHRKKAEREGNLLTACDNAVESNA
jgi:hypothetical protein